MRPLRSTALAIALSVVIAPAASAAPADRDSRTDPTDQMIAKINKVRAAHGLAALREAPKLARSSRGYAGHLIRTNSFGHGSSYARTGFRRSGEILALRSGPGQDQTAPFLRMWMRSPGHRVLILDRLFRYIGVSPAQGDFNGRPTTIWVAHFGAR